MLNTTKETVSLKTCDGVRLDADIYRPKTSERLPILLMRQPYGRAIASTVVYAHPRWYASQGYIVVIQDVRGRGSSEGEFKLFANEVADGIETINWLEQLEGSNGEIGMYGFSYQGMTQLYAATGKSTALKAIAPAMVGYDLYSDWAYENGAFCLYANLGWAIQLAAETARRKGDDIAYQKLYAAARNLPLSDRQPANPDLMQEFAADSFYHDWLANSRPSDYYWRQLSPKYLLDDVDLPMLHIGGWFDPYLRGTLNLYEAMVKRAKTPQHLIVAPWAHLPWGQKLGVKDYGSKAQNYIDEIQVRWFDHFLKGKDTGLLAEAPISLFEMGSNRWLELDKFPEAIASYYLASDGLAATKLDSGKLWETPESISDQTNSADFIVHDPWRPVPALGGHASFPGGSCDRSSLDCRADILTYTSDILVEDLSIVGVVNLELYCQSDRSSFDLCAVLSEVYSDGRVFNFTQGYIRVYNLQICKLYTLI
ncbi:MAG: CocE/NonD family hydrolase [Cyanobacteria bacterium J06642_3]